MPAFPQAFQSTVSHWQATNRGPTSLWNHGRDATLPSSTVDYVIVGAGATGTALSYWLSRPGAAGEGKSIVLLDAKDVASCASGRNGGHVAPHAWQVFGTLVKPLAEGGSGLTPEEALDLVMFEQANLDVVHGLLKAEGLDSSVDFWRGHRLEVITSRKEAEENIRLHALMQRTKANSTKHRDTKVDWELISDPAEATRVTRLKGTLQVNRIPAGSWHPHRGVTAILRLALESKTSNMQFFSWAPVASVDGPGPDGLFSVDCGARGTVRARKVIIATNAYTRHLIPEFGTKIIPFRGHACLVTPPATFAGPRALRSSYGVEDGPYLIQTPHSGLVFGPYTTAVTTAGIGTKQDLYDIEDDSHIQPSFYNWMKDWCRNNYIGWGEEGPSEGISRAWCGIMGHSVDQRPLMGEIPGRPGMYISAGYTGHGMATIHSLTRGLAHLLKTGQWDQRVPAPYRVTASRLEASNAALDPRTEEPQKGKL